MQRLPHRRAAEESLEIIGYITALLISQAPIQLARVQLSTAEVAPEHTVSPAMPVLVCGRRRTAMLNNKRRRVRFLSRFIVKG